MAENMHELIDSKTADLELLLSGSGLTVERFRATAYQLWDRNFAVRKCTPQSVLSGIMAIAEVGLTLAPSLGHAYLVPFDTKQGGTIAVPIIGYKGLIHLAVKSGGALDIRPGIVRKGELFKFRPVHPTETIVHEPPVDEETGEVLTANNAPTGYYAVAYLSGGLLKAAYMTATQVQQHRMKYSKSQESLMTPEQYGMKTLVRQVCKFLRLSGNPEDVKRFERAVAIATVEEQRESIGELTEDETPRAAQPHSDPSQKNPVAASQGGLTASADNVEAEGNPGVSVDGTLAPQSPLGLPPDAPADKDERKKIIDLFNSCKAPWKKRIDELCKIPGFTSIEDLRKSQLRACEDALKGL